MKIRRFLIGICISTVVMVTVGLCLAGSKPASPASGKRSYLIEMSRGNHASPSYIAEHADFIETMPFDGMVIEGFDGMQLFNPNPRIGNRGADLVWTTRMFEDDLSPITSTTFKKFKQNCVRVLMSDNGPYGAFSPPDVFDDWTPFLKSIANYAKVIKRKGIRGIILDDEDYSGGAPYWIYSDKNSGVRYYTQHSLQEYVNQSRLRGKQLAEAAVKSYSEIVIIVLHGPYIGSTTYGNVTGTLGMDNHLLGAFAAGVIEGCPAPAKAFDGGELYDLRTASQFQKSYDWRKYTITDRITKVPFMDNRLRNVWTKQCNISFGLFDRLMTPPNYPLITDMKEVSSSITNALHRSDGYVWHYTESFDWWRDQGVSGTLPPVERKWINAVAAGKRDGQKKM